MVEKVNSKFTFGIVALLFFILASLTQIAFFLLKVFNVIDWNWVWVCLPVIIIGGLLLLLVCFLILYILIVGPGRDDDKDPI